MIFIHTLIYLVTNIKCMTINTKLLINWEALLINFRIA